MRNNKTEIVLSYLLGMGGYIRGGNHMEVK